MSLEQNWADLEAYMRDHGVADIAIRIFGEHYRQVASAQPSFIREDEIEPVPPVADLEQLSPELEQIGSAELPRAVMLKLNGGLGTGMGLAGPKSLLPLREGQTFLDLIVAQVRALRVPLLLMNSFATDAATKATLANTERAEGVRIDTFLQHRVPKLRVDDLSAIRWPAQEELAWCPPGHGDVYAAMLTSGTLERLLTEGYRWLFVSNADNLGATLDVRILGYMKQQGASFLMEVADRTLSDRKGGHLARRADGTLLLREKAQCHDDDQTAFQDVEKHCYFNTNNLWIDLRVLADELQRHGQMLPLSLIVNRKTVDPTDATSPAVYQLETAMGSAISCLPHSTALRVPRARFAPVKTTEDLLAIRSDAYQIDQHHAVRLIEARQAVPPVVKLDDRYYKTIGDLDQHISVCPSLRDCDSLTIEGPVEFHQKVTLRGDVELINHASQAVALSASELTGRLEFRAE